MKIQDPEKCIQHMKKFSNKNAKVEIRDHCIDVYFELIDVIESNTKFKDLCDLLKYYFNDLYLKNHQDKIISIIEEQNNDMLLKIISEKDNINSYFRSLIKERSIDNLLAHY